MSIRALDHLVLTVTDREATRRFWVDGLGMEWRESDDGRIALHFGRQKINLHFRPGEFQPAAARPVPGSADLCFLVDEPLGTLARRLAALGHPVIAGPVRRTGATGPLVSIYIRDPDGNLVELSEPCA